MHCASKSHVIRLNFSLEVTNFFFFKATLTIFIKKKKKIANLKSFQPSAFVFKKKKKKKRCHSVSPVRYVKCPRDAARVSSPILFYSWYSWYKKREWGKTDAIGVAPPVGQPEKRNCDPQPHPKICLSPCIILSLFHVSSQGRIHPQRVPSSLSLHCVEILDFLALSVEQ